MTANLKPGIIFSASVKKSNDALKKKWCLRKTFFSSSFLLAAKTHFDRWKYEPLIFCNFFSNDFIGTLSTNATKPPINSGKIISNPIPIGDNLPKFLKSSVENDVEVITILQDKIREELEDCSESNINDIKECLGI